ncbi:MAG: phage major capsid protein [Deltaproteobacteria bacterium]|nr:phage major capsid protein [Deltaproteobacteria bacterium]
MLIAGTQVEELRQEAHKLLADAAAILTNAEHTAEDRAKAFAMKDRAMEIKEQVDALVVIGEAAAGLEQVVKQENKGGDQQTKKPKQFKTLGQFFQGVYAASFRGYRDDRLEMWSDPTEPATSKQLDSGWIEGVEKKDLLESIGASGGFLVPVEQRTELLRWPAMDLVVRPRATVIPMRRRSIRVPVLDQTSTTSGQPHWWGGVLAFWTEEAESKHETDPSFRQIELVAHKLATYTEASDELLADSAISLEAFLAASFSEVIAWEEEDAFLTGTGAGQPLGVITAVNQPTLVVTPQAALNLAVADFATMLENFVGRSPVWMMSQRWMSELIQLNGPAGNPSYVFIPNAREDVPATLFGYPIFWNEHMPLPGNIGSVLLADWSKYLIGDREATTIDSSKHFRFQNDLTAWRAVHRVDGQPWLSAPLTYQDGTTQVSPFVILGTVSGT